MRLEFFLGDGAIAALAGTLLAVIGASVGCGSTSAALDAAASSSSSVAGSGGGGAAASSASVATTGSAVGAGGGGGGTDACAVKHASFQQLLDDTLPMTKATGGVLAIITPDCGKWVGASGQSTTKVPMKADDVLHIGSITKTFVATTVLELVGEGKLTLDDSLEQWLPGFPNGAGITIRELLNHTSGIFNYTADPDFLKTIAAAPLKKWAPQELVDIAAKNMPYFAPGASWEYSNTDYILLGMLVEKITGSPLVHALRSRLFDPTKLTSTTLDGSEAQKGTLAHGFINGRDVTNLIDPSQAWSAGAMISSAGDLVDWASALYGGSVLDPKLLGEMLTTVDTGTAGFRYGLGVVVLDPSITIDTAYGHNGAYPGYQSDVYYFPKEKIAVADIINSEDGSTTPLVVAALQALIQP